MAEQDNMLADKNPVLFYVLGVIYAASFAVTLFYVATAAPFL